MAHYKHVLLKPALEVRPPKSKICWHMIAPCPTHLRLIEPCYFLLLLRDCVLDTCIYLAEGEGPSASIQINRLTSRSLPRYVLRRHIWTRYCIRSKLTTTSFREAQFFILILQHRLISWAQKRYRWKKVCYLPKLSPNWRYRLMYSINLSCSRFRKLTVKNKKISFDFSIGTHATSIDQNLKIKFLKCHLLLRGNLKWPFIVASRRSESERGNGFFTFLSLKRWKVKGTEVFFSPRNIAHQKIVFKYTFELLQNYVKATSEK